MEQKKVNAGAQFFQTSLVFEIEGMEIWLNELAKRNILDKVLILVGVMPIRSLKMARILSAVPGVHMPQKVPQCMEAADRAGNAQEEGVQIALELIGKIRTYHRQGVSGIHLMPVNWDEIIPRIIREGDLLPESFPIDAPDLAAKGSRPAYI